MFVNFVLIVQVEKNPHQYTMSHDEILEAVDASVKHGIKEVHVVSAHNPNTGLQWYLDIFKKIKERYPKLHIKALTAAEIHFLSQEYNLSYEELIEKMIENGVSLLTRWVELKSLMRR